MCRDSVAGASTVEIRRLDDSEGHEPKPAMSKYDVAAWLYWDHMLQALLSSSFSRQQSSCVFFLGPRRTSLETRYPIQLIMSRDISTSAHVRGTEFRIGSRR